MARGELVVVVRPPGRDQFGDPLAGDEARYEVANTLVAPGPSAEIGVGAGAQQVDTDMTIYPPRSILQVVPDGPAATDEVEVRGLRYSIVGDPQDWGGRNRMVIVLRRVTG